MANVVVSKEEMLARVAIFKHLKGSRRPLIDAVLPEFEREIFGVIGGGVREDPTMRSPIPEAHGYHLSIIKAPAKNGTGLHNHTTNEVFMPLTGRWSVQWGDDGENELVLEQFDVISVPIGVMRGFRNESDHEALLMAIISGQDPGRVKWTDKVMDAVREKGFDYDDKGNIVEIRAKQSGDKE